MATHRYNTLSFALSVFFLLLLSPPCAAASRPPRDLLHSSCAQARYPSLCVQTLTNYANPAMKPLDLAQASVKVSLTHARTLFLYLKTLKVQTTSSSGFTKRQRVALSDCVEQISDSVAELSRTLNELQHLRMGTFQWQMNNAQTWASAALTDGDTCLDGLNDGTADGKFKLEVKRRVTDVAMLTSNALYLINRLGDSSTGKPPINSHH
ncbi:hypothetical protein VNO77_05477 [Canavalia gladiata]|uniref:Pectinesterase inhibitor domain-containing protein n=1 Tax=Canavalia gladiata TaxID=3824 RepID=A0AAN9N3M5_CANGL